jgi:phosphofructokinase-like protein
MQVTLMFSLTKVTLIYLFRTFTTEIFNKIIIYEDVIMRIGILTAGGDCPGINATIRGVCKTAINYYHYEVVGIHSGFLGLLNKDIEELNDKSLSGLLNLGGTMLGTSREKPFKKINGSLTDKPQIIINNMKELCLDCLVCIGGNGTQKTAAKFSAMGVPVVSIPKTIDNDIWGTDFSFGFDSAVSIATDAIDRLHSTASSHKRVMVIEVMGHKAGWIALFSGMAGGGDVILIPEIKYNIENVCDTIMKRLKCGKPYSIVVVAEGVQVEGNERPSEYIAKQIEDKTKIETRVTVLGYIQRGGSPTPFDRNLSTRMGEHAAEMIANNEFGRMVTYKGNKISSIPLEEIAGKLKIVTEDNDLMIAGKRMGICFG